MTSKRYFGTDGIRGMVGEHPITAEFMLQLGNAVGQVLRRNLPPGSSERPQVVIGKDTRISGYMIESALEAGFISAGVDVHLTGPLPTPGVAYIVRTMRMDLGVVISASHNPFGDNGIKFFSRDGLKLGDEWEKDVEDILYKRKIIHVDSTHLGRGYRIRGAADRYIEFCKSKFDSTLSLKGLKIVVDAAHGAAYLTAPAVFHELGAEVIAIGDKPNGFNINDQVGATYTNTLINAVEQHHADYGIALDGDADRIQIVDKLGRLYNGDELVYILAMHHQPDGVVGTLMTNAAIENALIEADIEFIRANVGDRYVLEQLNLLGWTIGGEASGHILVLDKHSTGDGTIAALAIFEVLAATKSSLQALLSGVTLFPQHIVNAKIKKGANWKGDEVENLILKAEAELDGGRVLVRPSGTEPVVRVMVEGPDSDQALAIAKSIAAQIEKDTQ